MNPELPGNFQPQQLRLWSETYHDSLLDIRHLYVPGLWEDYYGDEDD